MSRQVPAGMFPGSLVTRAAVLRAACRVLATATAGYRWTRHLEGTTGTNAHAGSSHHSNLDRSHVVTQRLSPASMRKVLSEPGEFAFLDVREQGVHAEGHPFHACSVPLSHLEMMMADLVPRRTVPVILLDQGDDGLADRAAGKLVAAGYSDLSVLDGGCAGWKTERRRAVQRRERAVEGVWRIHRASIPNAGNPSRGPQGDARSRRARGRSRLATRTTSTTE